MEYFVVHSYDSGLLSNRVNQLIRDGWELQGGVSVAIQDNDNCYFAQALVRKK